MRVRISGGKTGIYISPKVFVRKRSQSLEFESDKLISPSAPMTAKTAQFQRRMYGIFYEQLQYFIEIFSLKCFVIRRCRDVSSKSQTHFRYKFCFPFKTEEAEPNIKHIIETRR